MSYVSSAEGTSAVYANNLSKAVSNKRLYRTVSASLGDDWKNEEIS